MNLRRIAAAAIGLAAIAAGVIVAPSPAMAATKWDLTGTGGDKVGAWARGSYWWGGDGRLYVKVVLRDTVANKKDARVYLRAYYTHGDPREEVLKNSQGSGDDVTMTWDFRGDIYYIEGQECIDNAVSAISCASYGTIYPQ
ncbi:hypothetical protein [Phytohabitans aurantiacus]|uniref:Secreted protein n=1 Tax=Phytohabitans aurantiacus TaxID=3016789 RepID=A0ABQ5R6Z9_9ACTN|nr:hypothetical protein [Phytohabitans aurantiacus]GLI02445.1 hypothetical protein Pa4123_77230 [Phytohabitans aurantiacus]